LRVIKCLSMFAAWTILWSAPLNSAKAGPLPDHLSHHFAAGLCLFDSDASKCTPENTPPRPPLTMTIFLASHPISERVFAYSTRKVARRETRRYPPLFQFTDRVNDVRSVPEPPTWVVMLTGLLSLSGLSRPAQTRLQSGTASLTVMGPDAAPNAKYGICVNPLAP
jgi:hypothetical protein